MQQLNLYVPINSLGYGVVGYNIWKELTKTCDVTLWPIGGRVNPPAAPSEDVIAAIKKDIAKQDNFNPDAPCLKIWHENQLSERIGRGKYFVYPFFEINKFNERRISHLRSADTIIVPSNWAKDVVDDNIDSCSPIKVVPCGVDLEIFNHDIAKNIVDDNKCTFFNCGKWEIRKGHDVLHTAFKEAFEDIYDVQLKMMCENPFLNEEEKNYWESLYSDPRMKIIPRVQTQQELAEIMAGTDCGVFASRSEGWNLEALEMMAMGKGVIVPHNTAHKDYCTPDNSSLIYFNEEEPMYDGKWFVGDNGTWSGWNNDSYKQLIDHLRDFYEEWKVNPYKTNSQGIETARELSWGSAAQKFKQIIFGD